MPAVKPPPPPSSTPKTSTPAPKSTTASTSSKSSTTKLSHLAPVARPPRVVVNAVEGWGKTSLVAHAPDAAILMASGETGYETLLGAGLVPSVPAARIAKWSELLGTLDSLIEDHSGVKVLALDAMGGFERLCHEHVCIKEFGGEWGDRGFNSYQKGYEQSVTHWLSMLSRLDRLWDAGITIVILSHCRIKTFKNPLGSDYDRYVSDTHDKTWAATAKWADAILFGNFLWVVDKKGKGVGGTDRVVYTERRDSFDAKNRYGMNEIIEIPNDPSETWSTLQNAINHKEGA